MQIVGGRALPLQGFLELAVEGGKLLVERLQFLLGCQQLLVRRLVFLIDGQCLFVDRLLLFARNLKVADGALQLRSRGFEFLLEFGDPRNVPRRDEVTSFLLVFRLVNEANQQQLLALAQNRLYGDAERNRMAIVVCMAAGDDNARVLLTGPLDCRAELVAHALARHGEQIVRGVPRAPRADSGLSVLRNKGTRACG